MMHTGLHDGEIKSENSDDRQLRASRRMARLLIGGGLLVGAIIGAVLTTFGAGFKPHREPGIEGTWELASLGEQRIAPGSNTGVISQHIALRGGRITGETVVRPVDNVGSVRLPFPDESVDHVETAPDDPTVRVTWSGTYQVDEHQQMTLHVGKAVYFAKASLLPGGQTMQFNQDVILTVTGTGQYRRVIQASQIPADRSAPQTPRQL